MDPYKFKNFDPWIDGNMRMAVEIVRIFKNSRDFTLSSYEGQQDFYDTYMEKYDEYLQILTRISAMKNIIIDMNTFEIIRDVLKIFIYEKSLTFSHLLVAYIQILIKIDRIKSFKIGHNLNVLNIIEFNNNHDSEFIYNYIIDYSKQDIEGVSIKRIVPFTSLTGAFGINTFLYMYFNNIYPVACSCEPYIVHNGIFPG